MRRSILRFLGGMAALVSVLGAAPATLAGSASEPGPTILDHLTEEGSAVSLGFGVSPLRWPPAPAAVAAGAQGGESLRPLDPDPGGTMVSLDLTLKWPGAETTAPVEPYVVLGPALFVVEPDYVGRLRGTRVDPTLRLGARAGAGLNWRLGKHATVFGAYEVTTAGQGGLTAPGATAPADTGITGYDLTYGLRFRY
jgi:hypothetical protein